jgi:hypothetical protein
VFVFKSKVNSFHYLYQDAEYFHQIAQKPDVGFDGVRASRTALLLYILSLEALINRALDHFLPERLHDFFLEREERFSLEEKWLLLPLLTSGHGDQQFDRSRYPWSHFVELIKIRNDFAHPKHDRPAFYEALTAKEWRPLSWKHIPDGLDVKESDLIYRQTQIPRDPYAVRVDHVNTVRSIVDAIISELDRLLDGRVIADDWKHKDEMALIWPAGATTNDLCPRGSV